MAADLKQLAGAVEIIPDRLYWTSDAVLLQTLPAELSSRLHTFNIDLELVYEPFFADFGPLDLGMMYRYCRNLDALLKDPSLQDKVLIHTCARTPSKRTNAAFLVCAYQVFVNRMSADFAFQPFEGQPPFLPFRDASTSRSSFDLEIIDCLRGLEKGIELGWLDYRTFDYNLYAYFARVENGDMTWIVPGKFLAFVGPSDTSPDAEGLPVFTPRDYGPHFRNGRIGMVIRLNNKQYDRRRFMELGIRHADLYFPDGSCPSKEIIHKFLQITEAEPTAVAVHCKAGLGRTGTLIGLYSMKNYGFSARAWIGWNRLCRPGSVLGIQQQFLVDMEREMNYWRETPRLPMLLGPNMPLQQMSEVDKLQRTIQNLSVDNREDVGQGERLVNAKAKHSAAMLRTSAYASPLNFADRAIGA